METQGALPHLQMQPPVPTLSQIDPVLAPIFHFLKTHLNIILPSKPGSSKWFFPSGFPTQTLYTPLLFPQTCYIPRPWHSSRFVHPNNAGWGVQIINIITLNHWTFSSVHNSNVKCEYHTIWHDSVDITRILASRRPVTLNEAFRNIPQSCQAKFKTKPIRKKRVVHIISDWLFTNSTLQSRIPHIYIHEQILG
jgi:hypothetical protein